MADSDFEDSFESSSDSEGEKHQQGETREQTWDYSVSYESHQPSGYSPPAKHEPRKVSDLEMSSEITSSPQSQYTMAC